MGKILNFDNNFIMTNNISKIINDVIDDIKKAYPNIHCSFEKITYSYNNELHKSFDTLASTFDLLSNISPYSKTENLSIETGKKEIQTNDPVRKKFVIFTDKLYYRVFELEFGEFYPVNFKAENFFDNQPKECSNDDELIKTLEDVFYSKRIYEILKKLNSTI